MHFVILDKKTRLITSKWTLTLMLVLVMSKVDIDVDGNYNYLEQ